MGLYLKIAVSKESCEAGDCEDLGRVFGSFPIAEGSEERGAKIDSDFVAAAVKTMSKEHGAGWITTDEARTLFMIGEYMNRRMLTSVWVVVE